MIKINRYNIVEIVTALARIELDSLHSVLSQQHIFSGVIILVIFTLLMSIIDSPHLFPKDTQKLAGSQSLI